MKSSRVSGVIVALPLVLALSLALGALGFTATVALFAPHSGIPVGDAPAGNLAGVARSYLFRSALGNSLLVGALVLAMTGILAHQVLRAGEGVRAIWVVWRALAAAPLFLPAAVAALLWRPLAAPIDLANHPDGAVALLAAALIWRLWPLALFAGPVVGRSGAARGALAVGLAAFWLALLDASGPLLLTGGQPFNATQGWASWAFHTLWVSRLWGHGAVMLGGLAAMSALTGSALLYLTARSPVAVKAATSQSPASLPGLIAGAVVAVVPLALYVRELRLAETAADLAGLARAGYFHWLANTVLVWLAAWLVATAISAARVAYVRARGWVRGLSLLAGLGAYPLWYLAPARVSGLENVVDGRILLAVAAGICAGLIVYGLAGWGRSTRRSTGWQAGVVSALLVLNHFAAEIVLEGSRRSYPLGGGMSLFVADNPLLAGERGWGLLLAFAAAWVAAYVAMRSRPDW